MHVVEKCFCKSLETKRKNDIAKGNIKVQIDINPAYAGKRLKVCRRLKQIRVQPRLRGKKS